MLPKSSLSDRPCWCGEGKTSCAYYTTPKEHLHCFKCSKSVFDKEKLIEYFEAYLPNMLAQEIEQKQRPSLKRGVITELKHRGISKFAAEKYNVETIFNEKNEPEAVAYPSYKTHGGELTAQKVKTIDGSFQYWTGDTSDISLFGMSLFPSGGKYITITEGEEDALAAYEMLKTHPSNAFIDPAVVSITDGAASAYKNCKKHWEYINSFENIIISFDGDDVGQKAALEVAKLFHYKPKILKFGDCKKDENGKWLNKDANDYLKAGRGKDFTRMWWNSEKVTPKGILSFQSLWDAMMREDTDLTVPYPWPGLEAKLHGMRTGQLVIIKAQPKIGKTQILRELAYHIFKTTQHNVGLIFLEDTQKSIGMGFCALELNKPIQFPDVPVSMEELQNAHTKLAEGERFAVFDPQDERTVENIFSKVLYFVKALDCKFVILDHISMLAYQNDNMDERRFLDKLLADLKGLTTSLNVCILAVTHVNDDGKTRGSRAPVQLCNALISLERDKLNPDPVIANTTDVIVEENRLTGDSGLACKLFFDRDTGRLTELDLDLLKHEEDKGSTLSKFRNPDNIQFDP